MYVSYSIQYVYTITLCILYTHDYSIVYIDRYCRQILGNTVSFLFVFRKYKNIHVNQKIRCMFHIQLDHKILKS